jgi:hypothetical protein
MTFHAPRLAAGLAIVTLLINFAVQWPSAHRVEFSSEASRISLALQTGRGFADPYLTGPSGPTTQRAPLYPFLHALICLLFGIGAAGWAAIVAITSLVWAVQWIYVYRFAALWGQAKAGAVAAWIGALLPLQGRMFKWEGVFAGAVLAAAAFDLSRLTTGAATKWTPLRWGLLLAASVLFSPATALIWPVWMGFVLNRLGWKRARPVIVTAFLVAAAPISGWIVRNYLVFHHPIFVRGDLVAVASSYNDCAEALMSRNRVCAYTQHPSASPALFQQLVQQGEYQFDAGERRRAIEWISSHPRRFAILTLQHAALFWFPIDDETRASLIYGYIFSICTVLSIFSIGWFRCPGFWIAIAAIVPFSATYYLVQFEQRYLYPTLWVTILLACVGCARILARNPHVER